MFEATKRWSGAMTAVIALGAMVAAAPASAEYAPIELDGGQVVTSDHDRAVFSTRNGIAFMALAHARLAAEGTTRSVLLFGEEPGMVAVDLGDDGAVLAYDAVGFGDDAALDVVFAVEDQFAVEEPDAHLSNGAGFIENIQAETGIVLFGVVDMLIEEQSASLLVYVDPMSMFEHFMLIFDLALSTGIYGDCSSGGYVGELCDMLGDSTGCACFDMPDSDTGISTWESLTDASAPDPFQWLWDAWEKSEQKRKEKKKKKGNKMAPWSEGPMFITDTIGELQIQGLLDELLPLAGGQ